MSTTYLWVKALHIVFVASWFAGLFYLPRLFVHLATAPSGRPASPAAPGPRGPEWGPFVGPGAVAPPWGGPAAALEACAACGGETAMTPRHRSSTAPLALAYAALILYASLYPFDGWRWPTSPEA